MPDISILMITYNHESFIAQAIEGVLLQQTTYSFELIIGEDCGTDNTRKICEQYAQKYPDTIKLLPSDGNYGMAKNFIRILEASTGKYIAMCEGDDFWIDKNKLQTQVDFLEKNPTYSLCFHDIYHLNGKRKTVSGKWNAPDTSDINYVLSHRGYMTTLSAIFRSHPSVAELLKKAVLSPYLDFFIYVAVAQYGLFKFFPARMGVYRVHQGGVWSSLNMIKATENAVKGYRILYPLLSPEQQHYFTIKCLANVEDFYLQAGIPEEASSIEQLVVKEMGVAPYVLDYIKQQVREQSEIAFLVKKVPIKKLFYAIWYKIKKRF